MQDPWKDASLPRVADQLVQPPLTHVQRQRISIGEAACSEPFAPHHTPSLAPRQRWPCAVDEQMPTHQPTHPCCCGGSPWVGHHPSVPGHSYPEVGPEVEAVAPGGLAASEVLSVSCEERVVRSSPPSLLLPHMKDQPWAPLFHCVILDSSSSRSGPPFSL